MKLPPSAATPSSATPIFSQDDFRRAAQGDAATIARMARALRAGEVSRFAEALRLPASVVANIIMRLRPKDARALLGLLPDKPNLAVPDILDLLLHPASALSASFGAPQWPQCGNRFTDRAIGGKMAPGDEGEARPPRPLGAGA